MTQTTRWRLTWWLSGTPEKSRHIWFSHACKLCAARRAFSLGSAMAMTENVALSNVRWSVATVKRHMTEPEIVLSGDSAHHVIRKAHAH